MEAQGNLTPGDYAYIVRTCERLYIEWINAPDNPYNGDLHKALDEATAGRYVMLDTVGKYYDAVKRAEVNFIIRYVKKAEPNV